MRICKNDESKKSVLLVFLNILFYMCFFIWAIGANRIDTLQNLHRGLFPWVCFLIIIQIVSFRIKKISFYDFGFWYLILSYLFMFGLLFKDILKLETTLLWEPISNYSSNELFDAYIFVLTSLEAFSFGYCLFYKNKYALKKDSMDGIEPNKRMYNIGIILLVVGGLCRIINDFQIVYVTRGANTYAAYSGAISSGLWDDLACLVLPGVFFLFFCGLIDERKKRILFYVVLLYFVFIMLLTGSRKTQIFSILSLFLGYDFSLEKKKKSIWKICIYFILLVLLINIVIIIRENRFDLATILPALVENITSFNLFNDIIGETLAETGITFLSVASIVKVVPSIFPFEYGITFLRTIPSFLPIGWLVGDFFEKASSTYVINTYTKIPVGSSFIGDLYWNWGCLGGTIAAFLFGAIISWLLRVKHKKNVRVSYAAYFALFSQLIVLVRAELFDIFRPIIMMIFFIWVVKEFSKKR